MAEEEKTLIVIPDRCVGCKTCMMACSIQKGSIKKPAQPRIRIYPVKESDNVSGNVQITCLQCVDAACVAVCTVHALARNESTGAIVLNEDRCISCGLCEPACPYGNIYFNTLTGFPEKCDLCGGDPACAKYCPHEALLYK